MTARLTIAEVAQLWRCSRRAVLDRIYAGDLPATKPAGQWLIEPDDVAAYEAAHRRAQPAPRRRRRRVV